MSTYLIKSIKTAFFLMWISNIAFLNIVVFFREHKLFLSALNNNYLKKIKNDKRVLYHNTNHDDVL